ncbi:hypothetical protein GCM10009001_27720 [Virgibacillus siamensis]|uniref:Imm-5-like domain-containing protein n=1 Tax=Virgibacillus siamensis TaxID=480071 RepID=A0ABN1GCU6_9BACI
MVNRPKIKIVDDADLRQKIEKNADLISQVDLAKWAIIVAKHILPYLEKEFPNSDKITNGFETNELWQRGKATVHQVRQAGFKVHEVARECKSETAKSAARAVGQAVGVGHMRGHAMMATDYAIKVINLAFNNDIMKVTEERDWQLYELNKYIKGEISG